MANAWWQANQGRAAQNRDGAARNRGAVAPCDLEDGGGSNCSSGDGGNDNNNNSLGTGKMNRNTLRKVHAGGGGETPAVPSQIGFCGLSSRSVTAAAAALSVADGHGGGTASSRTVVEAAAALAATSGGLPELFRSARANSAATSAGSGRLGISSSRYNSYRQGYADAEVGVKSIRGRMRKR